MTTNHSGLALSALVAVVASVALPACGGRVLGSTGGSADATTSTDALGEERASETGTRTSDASETSTILDSGGPESEASTVSDSGLGDGHAPDANADANCGPDFCAANEYCYVDTNAFGWPPKYHCATIPATCEPAPTCACVLPTEYPYGCCAGGCVIADSGLNLMTVTCFECG